MKSEWQISGKHFRQIWMAGKGRARLCCFIGDKLVSSATFEAEFKAAKKAERDAKAV